MLLVVYSGALFEIISVSPHERKKKGHSGEHSNWFSNSKRFKGIREEYPAQ